MIELRADGGRVTDPPPEYECAALCGAPAFRKGALCSPCYVLREKDRDLFRARLKKRGFTRRNGAWRPPRSR